MNFYIGKSVEEIDCLDMDVEIDDMLLDYVYKISRYDKCDRSVLYHINPYDDTLISQDDVVKLKDVCEDILSVALLEDYSDKEKGKRMLTELIEISQSAIEKGMGLVVIGD